MARATPHLDNATELARHLALGRQQPPRALDDDRLRLHLLAQQAVIESNLAIAEALHGVLYCANANAV